LGYPQKKIIGENWFDRFVTPSMRLSALKSLEKLFSGEKESEGYIVIPIINKIDLVPVLGTDLDRMINDAKSINPNIKVIPMSAKTGENFNEFLEFLNL